MQAIRDWLRANPERAQEIMQRNARYIFFRPIEGEGPIGAQGVPPTPGPSLAVDSSLLPLGVPLWLDPTWPATDKPSTEARLVWKECVSTCSSRVPPDASKKKHK